MVVISRDDTTAPADTPIPVPSPLEEPSPDEVAAASNAGVYVPGSGPTEVTATRSYVSLRRVTPPDSPLRRTGGLGLRDWLGGQSRGALRPVGGSLTTSSFRRSTTDCSWHLRVVVTGSAVGTTGMADRLGDRPTRPADGGWTNRPRWTLPSKCWCCFPPHPIPWNTDSGERFLPRVVDRRDWTIRPLSVPEDATAAVAIHQPGSGRIWIGTAPDGGDVGLAYTDDGGASWTDVELPESLRPHQRGVVGF